MKKTTKTISIVSIVVVLFVALLYFSGFQLSALQGSDGYTILGSDISIKDRTDNHNSLYWYLNVNTQSGNTNEQTSNPTLDPINPISSDQNLIFTLSGTQSTCQVLKKELYQTKLKADVDYKAQPSGSRGYRSSGVGVCIADNSNNCIISLAGAGIDTNSEISGTFGVETVPNLFDNVTRVYGNGVEKGNLTINGGERLMFCGSSYGGGYTTMTIKNVRYQPLLSCQKSPTDIYAQQSFTAGSIVTVDKFRFPVKQFCVGRSVDFLVNNNAEQNIESSVMLYQKLAEGQSVTVPEGQVWVVPYIFDNSKGLVSVTCSDKQNVDENGVCKQQAGFVYTLSQETVDAKTNTITATPKTICENIVGVKAIWDTTKETCTVPSPVIEYCDNTNGCELRVSTICENSKLTYDATTHSCVANVKVDNQGNVSAKTNWTPIIIGVVIVIFIILAILLMTRKRKRR